MHRLTIQGQTHLEMSWLPSPAAVLPCSLWLLLVTRTMPVELCGRLLRLDAEQRVKLSEIVRKTTLDKSLEIFEGANSHYGFTSELTVSEVAKALKAWV